MFKQSKISLRNIRSLKSNHKLLLSLKNGVVIAAMKNGKRVSCSLVSFVFCVRCVHFLSLFLPANKFVRIVKKDNIGLLQRRSRTYMRSIGGNCCLNKSKRKIKNQARKNNKSRKRIKLIKLTDYCQESIIQTNIKESLFKFLNKNDLSIQ